MSLKCLRARVTARPRPSTCPEPSMHVAKTSTKADTKHIACPPLSTAILSRILDMCWTSLGVDHEPRAERQDHRVGGADRRRALHRERVDFQAGGGDG